MTKPRRPGPWGLPRRAAGDPSAFCGATADDVLPAMRRALVVQRGLTLRLVSISGLLAILSVVDYSQPHSIATAIVILGFAALANRGASLWLCATVSLLLDTPSVAIVRMSIKVTSWALAGDLGAVFCGLLVVQSLYR